jgi:hypothetical protein
MGIQQFYIFEEFWNNTSHKGHFEPLVHGTEEEDA